MWDDSQAIQEIVHKATVARFPGKLTIMCKIDLTVLGDGRVFAKANAWVNEAKQANAKPRPKPEKKKVKQAKITEDEVY